MKPVDHLTAGTFLVASPMLRDPNFVRTVVLMCEHGRGGSWGLVVNRRTALTYGELLEDLPFPAAAAGPVFWGGPCETSRMQVLHCLRRPVDSDLEVCSGVQLGLPPDTLRQVLASPLAPGESLHGYLGHAGWGSGQLDSEMEQGSWILCSGDAGVVFETPFESVWERVLQSLGPKYAGLANYPADPRLN